MTYISFDRSPRVRLPLVAGVVALHALVWMFAGIKPPPAAQPDAHVTYADLRLVEPRPQPRTSQEPEAQAAAPRARTPIQVRPAGPRPQAPAPSSEPATAAAPIELLPAEPAGAPAGEPASAGKAIDVEALRMAARDYERTRERSPIEKHREQLRKEQHRDVAAEAIARSARADCRNAYGSLGLLAIIPLAVDAVREGGCKW